MKKKLLKQFKQMFEDKKREILKRSDTTALELDINGDDMDKIQGDVLGAIMEQLSRRSIKQLENIEKALNKIEDGTFGECEECGEAISEKRLLAKPDADTCITCAERLEYAARQFAS